MRAQILTTVLLRRLGINRVIAKARTRTQREILIQVGADEVALPEHEAGVRLARRFAVGHVIDYPEIGNDVGVCRVDRAASTSMVARWRKPISGNATDRTQWLCVETTS